MELQSITSLGIQEDTATKLLEQFNQFLTSEISKKQSELESDYKSQLESVKINAFLDQQLLNAGARNLKVVKALIDLSNLQALDENSIISLINELKNNEDTSFLFVSNQKDEKETKEKSQNQQKDTKFTGFKPFENTLNPTSKHISYEELCNYYDSTNNL